MANNQIKTIQYQFVFDKNIIGTDNAWTSILSEASSNGVSFSTYNPTGDESNTAEAWTVYNWQTIDTSAEGLFAGYDVSRQINDMNDQYEENFNKSVATSSMGVNSIGVLLNYFWFNANWWTYGLDETSLVAKFEHNNSILYVNKDGQVRLMTKLEPAVLTIELPST